MDDYELDFLLDASYEAEQEMLHLEAEEAVAAAELAHGLSLDPEARTAAVDALCEEAELESCESDERDDSVDEYGIPMRARFQRSPMLVVALKGRLTRSTRPLFGPCPGAPRRHTARAPRGRRVVRRARSRSPGSRSSDDDPAPPSRPADGRFYALAVAA